MPPTVRRGPVGIQETGDFPATTRSQPDGCDGHPHHFQANSKTNLFASRVEMMMGGTRRARTSKDLERIHDEHAVAMFRHGLALLRDETAVRDVLQDVFLKLAEGRADAVDPDSERAYLLRMVHCAAIDRMRRAKVRQDYAARAPAGLFESCADPDREAFRKQLEQALDQLPPGQREVVVLKLWEERTFDEISSICGIPLNTAASRYRYGIDKLRALLRPVYEEL